MTAAAAPFIATEALCKSFGPRAALSDVSLRADAGCCLAVLGANGAGKTTLLRILATLARPTSGQAAIAGLDLSRQAAAVRRRIGFLSHRTLLYDDLTARENLRFYGRVYDVPALPDRIESLLTRVGLSGRGDEPVRRFSRGMQQRLSLARAVLHEPDLLLLDEPDTGLDLQARQALIGLLEELVGDGVTVLLSTHDLDTAFALAGRIVVLSRGRLAGDWPAAEVDRRSFGATYLASVA